MRTTSSKPCRDKGGLVARPTQHAPHTQQSRENIQDLRAQNPPLAMPPPRPRVGKEQIEKTQATLRQGRQQQQRVVGKKAQVRSRTRGGTRRLPLPLRVFVGRLPLFQRREQSGDSVAIRFAANEARRRRTRYLRGQMFARPEANLETQVFSIAFEESPVSAEGLRRVKSQQRQLLRKQRFSIGGKPARPSAREAARKATRKSARRSVP